MAGKVIGIDLGTTMSVVAHTDVGGNTSTIADTFGQRIIPSVVYFPAGEPMVVGDHARRYAVVAPDRVAMLFKRGMGTPFFLDGKKSFVVDGKVWSPEELSSLVLRKMKQMAEDHFHEPVTDAIVTVPAYFGDEARSATVSAGELAGLNVLRIQNEPTAAAIAHGLDSGSEPGKILVFDLGGGTFDVTVMEIEPSGQLTVIATGGNRKLGGADFDNLILNRLREEARSQTGGNLDANPSELSTARDQAEALKKDLSSAQSAFCALSVGGKPLSFTLTRAEFEKMLERYSTEVTDTIENTLDDANVRPSALSKVLMVGGSSRIPVFQRLLAEMLGRKPTFSQNLDEDVARGAAMLAAKTANTVDSRSYLAAMPAPKDVTSQGLGVTAVGDDRVTEYNSVILPANSQIPGKESKMYETLDDGQVEVMVELNEGDDADLKFVRNLDKAPAKFGRAVRQGYPIRVDISYNEQQIIEAEAFDGETGKFLCNITVTRHGLMAPADKEAAMARLANLRVR
jgi:molecular chaperone DnaK